MPSFVAQTPLKLNYHGRVGVHLSLRGRTLGGDNTNVWRMLGPTILWHLSKQLSHDPDRHKVAASREEVRLRASRAFPTELPRPSMLPGSCNSQPPVWGRTDMPLFQLCGYCKKEPGCLRKSWLGHRTRYRELGQRWRGSPSPTHFEPAALPNVL